MTTLWAEARLAGVHHQHELHEVLGGREGALHQKHLAAAHALVEARAHLGVGEALEGEVAEGGAVGGSDVFGKSAGGAAGEDFDLFH